MRVGPTLATGKQGWDKLIGRAVAGLPSHNPGKQEEKAAKPPAEEKGDGKKENWLGTLVAFHRASNNNWEHGIWPTMPGSQFSATGAKKSSPCFCVQVRLTAGQPGMCVSGPLRGRRLHFWHMCICECVCEALFPA